MPNADAIVVVSTMPGMGFEYRVNAFIAFGAHANAGPLLINAANAAGARNTVVDFALDARAFFIFRWDRVAK